MYLEPLISVFPQLEMEGIRSREIEIEEKRTAKNKKERERVKRLEPIYEMLSSKVPRHQSAHPRGRKKQSRVFTLKSALTYIRHLKSLAPGCHNDPTRNDMKMPSEVVRVDGSSSLASHIEQVRFNY